MSFVIGIVIFVLGLLAAIALHELGHLLPAKKFGVKVPQYFVGFGPTLWSRTKGETEYGIKGIPLGGYVRLAGMYPPAQEPVPTGKGGRTTWAEEARAETRADLEPGEEHRAFCALSVPKKLAVMFGGPLMNWALALVLLILVMVVMGQGKFVPTITSVSPCLQPPGASQCAPGDKPSPAQASGLQPGDQVISWNGVAMKSAGDVRRTIRAGGTDQATVIVKRGDTELTLSVSPTIGELPALDKSGRPVVVDGVEQKVNAPMVGFTVGMKPAAASLTDAVGAWWDATGQTFSAIVSIPVQLWNTLTGAEGGARNVMSIVGVGQVAGNITSAPADGYTAALRAGDMLRLLASLNIALFAFNLIPLPPLDGGHMAGAAVEGLRRGASRLAGKPDPGPVDMARALPLTYFVVGLLLVMTVILVWADLTKPLL